MQRPAAGIPEPGKEVDVQRLNLFDVEVGKRTGHNSKGGEVRKGRLDSPKNCFCRARFSRPLVPVSRWSSSNRLKC